MARLVFFWCFFLKYIYGILLVQNVCFIEINFFFLHEKNKTNLIFKLCDKIKLSFDFLFSFGKA